MFNRCTTTNATEDSDITANSPNYMVNFNYEFLEDIRDPIAKNQSLFTHRYCEIIKVHAIILYCLKTNVGLALMLKNMELKKERASLLTGDQ